MGYTQSHTHSTHSNQPTKERSRTQTHTLYAVYNRSGTQRQICTTSLSVTHTNTHTASLYCVFLRLAGLLENHCGWNVTFASHAFCPEARLRKHTNSTPCLNVTTRAA